MSQRNAQYQLSSIIEMDDTYMGCTSHNSRCGREKDISKIMMAQSESYIGSCSVHLNKGCKRYQMQDATAAHRRIFYIRDQSEVRWVKKLFGSAEHRTGCAEI